MRSHIDSICLVRDYRIAENEDIPQIFALLNKEPETVIMRDIDGFGPTLLIDFVFGPFKLEKECDLNILCGLERKTQLATKIRIRGGCAVELANYPFAHWVLASRGGVRIYIPQ